MVNFNSEEKQFFKADNEPFNATVEYLTSSFASTEGHAFWLCLKEKQQQNMWSIEITNFSHFLTFVNPASILRYYACLIPEIYEKKKTKRKHKQNKRCFDSRHLTTLKKCIKHSPEARVFYLSFVLKTV